MRHASSRAPTTTSRIRNLFASLLCQNLMAGLRKYLEEKQQANTGKKGTGGGVGGDKVQHEKKGAKASSLTLTIPLSQPQPWYRLPEL